MKKILLAAAVAFALTSCGEDNTAAKADGHDDHAGHNHGTEQTDKGTAATPETPSKYTDKDPVCGMDRNEKWTEFTAKGTDTTWFCSPVCKEQFDADPAKFPKKA
ncbi:MAG: hypothetical protein BGO31_03580 [Bacteroidetes bacterium 43-16]|nr:MAG: hypothetical protein BGO31_03580 [Bacteroidetes bacterium 43-16]